MIRWLCDKKYSVGKPVVATASVARHSWAENMRFRDAYSENTFARVVWVVYEVTA